MYKRQANGITPQQIIKARNLSVFKDNLTENDAQRAKAYIEPERPNIAADPDVYKRQPDTSGGLFRINGQILRSQKTVRTCNV